jgi:hypothetical protein
MVDDDRWMPAEIRACCRLARRLRMPLHLAARRIGCVCKGERGEKTLERLHRWALSENALDSESGELYELVAEGQGAATREGGAADATTAVRRRVNVRKKGDE